MVGKVNGDLMYLDAQARAMKYPLFYHYTNFEALTSILTSRSFRLTQLKFVNDQFEESHVDQILKKKIFTASFTHRIQVDNLMWELYTHPHTGLRIQINRIDFLKDKSNFIFGYENWEIRSIDILDVMYLDNPEECYDDYFPLDENFGPGKYSTGNGFIKSMDWKHEEETRVRCRIDVTNKIHSRLYPRDYGTTSDEFKVKYENYSYNRPTFDYLFCQIPDDVINDMKFIFHPNMEFNRSQHIMHMLLKAFPFLSSKQFE